MAMEYTVWAKSPSLNQQIRQFNLLGMTNNIYTDERLAAQAAASFVQQLKAQRHMHTDDWEAWVKYEDVGIHTIPGYIK